MDSILWFIGAFCIFTAILAVLEFLYKLSRDVIAAFEFDVEKFKAELNRYLEGIAFENSSVIEKALDEMLIKFPEIDSINYNFNEEDNTLQLTVTTKNCRTFIVDVVPKKEND